MKLAVIVIFCSTCFAESNCHKCKTPRSGDVDWGRVDGSWYDVLDIPTTETAQGCWILQNATLENDDVVLTLLVYAKGERKKKHLALHYVRKRTGVYKLLHMQNTGEEFRSKFHHLIHDEKPKKSVESKINDEIEEFFTADWIFLTDYERYFIFDMKNECLETGNGEHNDASLVIV